MPFRFLIPVLAIALLPLYSAAQPQLQGTASVACAHDRARLLALDEHSFDQDFSGGWRAIADKGEECELVAADLLRDYRQLHKNDSTMLLWHEGQMRAFAGQYAQAIELMRRSRGPGDEDKGGWKAYVDATVAFLDRDQAALETARRRLAALAPPPGEKLVIKDGYFEVKTPDGQTLSMRWPPNIDVVEGLQNCFDQPYKIAYAMECRTEKTQPASGG
ncbi:hypothetical protein NM04_04615 [Massilia aurea]|uniref:Uncharacterized protein n=1 Tax=Massilia aurea TaxID=373040 RepID=A0A422QPG4_9BURK|nr:hypothetical protein [Massilia aurea]RNF31920.1 hypothetical protein NM04_04615 [Massilia aurea]